MGDSVQLSCTFAGASKFSFFRDNDPVQSWSKSSHFEISDFNISDIGLYRCQAGNESSVVEGNYVVGDEVKLSLSKSS